MSAAYEYADYDVDSPYGLAFRMAGYNKDAAYIARYVALEYGKHLAPSVHDVERMHQVHRRRGEAFARRGYLTDRQAGAENDNGEPFRVRGLVKPPKPPRPVKAVRPKVVHHEPSAERLKILERARDRFCEIRAERFAKAGPIARDIINRTAEFYLLTPYDLIGESRQAYVSCARMVAAKLLTEVLDSEGRRRFSSTQIGRLLGGRDHSTVLHMLNVFDKRAAKYPLMREAYEALRNG